MMVFVQDAMPELLSGHIYSAAEFYEYLLEQKCWRQKEEDKGLAAAPGWGPPGKREYTQGQ